MPLINELAYDILFDACDDEHFVRIIVFDFNMRFIDLKARHVLQDLLNRVAGQIFENLIF